MVTLPDTSGAQLIGLDWGSTSLRAMLIGASGRVLKTRSSAHGASTLDGSKAAYIAALNALADDWCSTMPYLPILACGMVGSKHGWLEVPYVHCPASAQVLANGMGTVDWHSTKVHIVPGLLYETPARVPDVIRGEETQVLGALEIDPSLGERSCIVMPGTHSKWAQVTSSAVRGFATFMTGELFAVLRQHSVLGRLIPSVFEDAPHVFEAGVLAARNHGDAGLPHQLFSVRTLGLTGDLPPEQLSDYMSGLLVGHELRAGLRWRKQAALADAPLLLIGEPALCHRYANALQLFGEDAAKILPNTAGEGLWSLAEAAKGVLG